MITASIDLCNSYRYGFRGNDTCHPMHASDVQCLPSLVNADVRVVGVVGVVGVVVGDLVPQPTKNMQSHHVDDYVHDEKDKPMSSYGDDANDDGDDDSGDGDTDVCGQQTIPRNSRLLVQLQSLSPSAQPLHKHSRHRQYHLHDHRRYKYQCEINRLHRRQQHDLKCPSHHDCHRLHRGNHSRDVTFLTSIIVAIIGITIVMVCIDIMGTAIAMVTMAINLSIVSPSL